MKGSMDLEGVTTETQRPGRLAYGCRRDFLVSVIPPGPPALRPGENEAVALGPGATRLLGKPGTSPPEAERQGPRLSQSEGARAVRLRLGRCGAAPGEVRVGGGDQARRLVGENEFFSEKKRQARQRRPSNSSVRRDTCPKWKPDSKVPLQTLHMTSENQEKVKALLRDLQEQDADAGSERGISGEEEDDEPDCDEEQYWSAGREASLVPDPDPLECAGSGLVEPHSPEFTVSTFAVQKLSRYGFNIERCQAALRICDGDVGASLEHLFTQCFSETFGERMKISEAVARISLDECVEQRQEEAFALKSICGEKFIERIQNRVWTIGLELEYLTRNYHKYPYQAPLVAFYSTNENLPLACQEESEIAKLLTNTHHKYTIPSNSIVSNQIPEVKKESEPEEETDEDEGPAPVVVENESYVNLKKKISKRYDWQAKSVHAENAKICKQFRIKQASRQFQSILQERQSLPAWEERENILELLSKHQVLVVSGMTGCGKTTQIPQFILDDSLNGPPEKVANIICTQPRRISAVSVAERVAKERAERVGLTVGYQIRLESVKECCLGGSRGTRLYKESPISSLMKFTRGQRKVITIPGRTFPVDQYFLEDAIAMTRYVLQDGSPYTRSMKQMSKEKLKARRSRTAFEEVEEDLRLSLHLQDQDSVKDAVPDQQLDFKQLLARYKGVSKSVIKTMSIMDFEKVNLELIEALLEWIVDGKHSYPPEIKMLYEQLQSNALFNNRRSHREEQQAVFVKPPVGVTKIIISTNIAETSITIDDVVYVIDSGKMKEKRYDASKGMESLEDTFVSQANALQRKGRADVRIGKLMLFGSIFRCLDPALTIAASLAFKSPFVSPWDKKEEANQKKLEFAFANSDYLALLRAYKEMASLKRQFTELLSDIGFVKEGLRAREIEKRAQGGGDGILDATGEEANSNAENPKLISAMLCAALYPNVVQVKSPEGKFQKTSTGAVRMQPKSDELKFVTKNDGYVHIHPSSVNYQVRHFDSPYLVYHEKIKTSRVFIRDCSMVSVYPLVLFGGGQVHVQLQRGEFVVSLDDGWIRFAAASHQRSPCCLPQLEASAHVGPQPQTHVPSSAHSCGVVNNDTCQSEC
ncbi:DEAH (Asp-Glu-Ala-Asp/His) box polypeptide 57 [Camelus ferus]|nr:DEAH (Asp-Glu-Ala-Asp/His) box polypeptide 57 [Camelus ferus]